MRHKIKLRYTIIAIIIITTTILYFYSNAVNHQLLNIAYLTRPIWDKPRKSFEVKVHYHSPDLSIPEMCSLHQFTKLEQPKRIFDATLFSVELDLLEIRLHELYDVIEKFIIVESNSTFTGISKPLLFQENRERFAFAKDKILYKSIKVPPLPPGEDPFTLEEKHRIAINSLLIEAGIQQGDWLLMMDVDEIPAKHTIELFRNCGNIPSPIHLQLRNYIYSFEFLLDMESWRGKAVRYNGLNPYNHNRQGDYMLADAGWHCSFCFRRIQDFKFKMQGYSHADRVHFSEVLDSKHIQKVICDGSDIYKMLPEAYNYKDLFQKWGSLPKQTSGVGLPSWLLKNAEKYAFLLPGGCDNRDP